MKKRKIPMRMCIITKEKVEKQSLIRIVKTPDNQVIIDLSGKANGKGAYLKKDKEVILKGSKTNQLQKALEIDIPSSIYDELLAMIDN